MRVSVPTDVVERLRAWAETKPEIRALWIFGSAITEPRVSEIRVDTIGDLVPGCAIWACCDGCRRSAKLNLVKLRMQYGPGLLLDDLKRCVTCRRCTQRTAEIRLVNSAK